MAVHRADNAQGKRLDAEAKRSPIRRYLTADLRVDTFIEAQLLLLTFSTGIQDSIAFPDFHCFASNQTGNSVILAVGAAGLAKKAFSLANVGISLGTFIAGAILTGQIAHLLGPRKRYWLIFNHLLQTLLVFAAAIIQAKTLHKGRGPYAAASIAVLAFSSGAQVSSMRPMRIPEITTAMATAAWVDFVIDPRLIALGNHSRDRRAAFLIALIGGSFVGAFMYKKAGSTDTLILSAAGKLLVTLSLLFNREKRSRPSTDE